MPELFQRVDTVVNKKDTNALPEEIGEVYAVVNKPSPPLIHQKSDLLMEKLNEGYNY